MKQPHFSRRGFLRGLGVSAAAVPFVLGLSSLFAKATAAEQQRKRFVFMYTPFGSYYYNWRLRLPALDADISDGSAFSEPNSVLAPLKPNAQHLLVLDRLSLASARNQYQSANASPDQKNHPGTPAKGMASLLTGQRLIGGSESLGDPGLANGRSVDQVIAAHQTQKTPFASLEVGVQTNEVLADRYACKRLSYEGPALPRAPQNDPFVLFSKIFGGSLGAPESYRSFVDKSVFDGVLGDFTRLQSKLSVADRALLDQHVQAVRELEMQLATLANCALPDAPDGAQGLNIQDPAATHKWSMTRENFPEVGDLMSAIIAQALACDLTNVVTWSFANAEDDRTYPWLPQISTQNLGANGMQHRRDPNLTYIGQWYAEQFGKFINRLSVIPDSGSNGSVLDNSLLAWSSDLSDTVSNDNLPFVLAGSNGGYFRTGRSLRFDDVWTKSEWEGRMLGPTDGIDATIAIDLARSGDGRTIGPNDRTNNDLWVSVLNSFGVETETFGDPALCKGPLPGLKA